MRAIRTCLEIFGLFVAAFLVGTGIVALVWALSGCLTPSPAPGPYPDGDPCEPACEAATRLGCPAGRGGAGPDDIYGTADDVPCVEACEDFLRYDPSAKPLLWCTAGASSCESADACADLIQ